MLIQHQADCDPAWTKVLISCQEIASLSLVLVQSKAGSFSQCQKPPKIPLKASAIPHGMGQSEHKNQLRDLLLLHLSSVAGLWMSLWVSFDDSIQSSFFFFFALLERPFCPVGLQCSGAGKIWPSPVLLNLVCEKGRGEAPGKPVSFLPRALNQLQSRCCLVLTFYLTWSLSVQPNLLLWISPPVATLFLAWPFGQFYPRLWVLNSGFCFATQLKNTHQDLRSHGVRSQLAFQPHEHLGRLNSFLAQKAHLVATYLKRYLFSGSWSGWKDPKLILNSVVLCSLRIEVSRNALDVRHVRVRERSILRAETGGATGFQWVFSRFAPGPTSHDVRGTPQHRPDYWSLREQCTVPPWVQSKVRWHRCHGRITKENFCFACKAHLPPPSKGLLPGRKSEGGRHRNKYGGWTMVCMLDHKEYDKPMLGGFS